MSEVTQDQVMQRIPSDRKDVVRSISLGNKIPAGEAVSSTDDSVFSIEYTALVFNVLIALTLVVFYLALIKPLVFLPADLLMWEEGDFVGNIIKLNIGAPLYTNPADSNSLIYNPGAFLLTYAVAWVTGGTKSVVALRLIQLGFVTVAVFLATVSCRQLSRLSFPSSRFSFPGAWTVFTFLALFLAATTPNTNKFVYCLHVDATALLVVALAIWAMLRYAEHATIKNLLLMAICPALGFLTKQFLVSLVPVMVVFLLILRPREIKRIALYLAVSIGLIGVAYALCYALWGSNFIFWTFEVMGGSRKAIVFSADANSISIARALDHLARVWIELVVGVIGAWWLVRFGSGRTGWALAGAWIVLIASETFSSGAGWETLYHFGPGVLLGAIFMLASLPSMWRTASGNRGELVPRFASAFLMTSVVAGIFLAWRVVPTGDRSDPRYVRAVGSADDLGRYVGEIESEFDGLPSEKVLMDVGSWVYLRDDILQKDRAVSLGDQPLANIYENFDVTVERVRNKTYSKILVHDFNTPFFLYDWAAWTRPSGFRKTLLENYIEIRTIAPAQGHIVNAAPHMYVGPVSVFVPRN